MLRAARLVRPSFRIIDSADDLRLVEMDGSRDRFFVSTARFVEPLSRVGFRSHTLEGGRWWPTQSIPLIGSFVKTNEGVVEIEARERRKGMSLRDAVWVVILHANCAGHRVVPLRCPMGRARMFSPPPLRLGHR